MRFSDRRHAGRQLAGLLDSYRGEDTLVLGLPRGGVPVAFEVARHLDAPLDVMVARKIGAPSHPEFGIGAVAPGGIRVLDEAAMRAVGVEPGEVDQIIHDELQEMERRLMLYRGAAVPPDVRGKTALLVDDGLATGVSATAALRALRAQGPRRLVLAVPVGAPETVEAMRREADEVVCVVTPEDFRAVGLWYRSFDQTTDEEVLALLEAARPRAIPESCPAQIPLLDGHALQADLTLPRDAGGIVVFAHGSGSGRHSPRNRQVARGFQQAGLGTLLLDLLTPEEEAIDARSAEFRFDIPRLSERLAAAVDWLRAQDFARDVPIGLYGSSTGAAAALRAAAQEPDVVAAVVSRGGRPDLAGDALPDVRAATLLLVGGRDEVVLGINLDALARIPRTTEKELVVIPGATHLFEEEGALEEAARLAAGWFVLHLSRGPIRRARFEAPRRR